MEYLACLLLRWPCELGHADGGKLAQAGQGSMMDNNLNPTVLFEWKQLVLRIDIVRYIAGIRVV